MDNAPAPPASGRVLGNAELLRELCFVDFVCGATVPMICAERGVNRNTVDSWHRRYQWKAKREALIARLTSSNEGKLAVLFRDNQLPFAKDLVRALRLGQGKLLTGLRKRKLDPKELHTLARTMKTLSDTGTGLLLPSVSGRAGSGPNRGRGPALTLRVLLEGPRDRLSEAQSGVIDVSDAG